MVYTVDRRTWYRGKDSSYSKLLREDGLRCCIGFVGQQCGYRDDELLGCSAITRVKDRLRFPSWMHLLSEPPNPFRTDIEECYGINDNSILTDAEREANLIEIFARNGDTLVFIN